MTSNRQNFIKLIAELKGMAERHADYIETHTQMTPRRDHLLLFKELLRLYDLNHKTLNQGEINRLATAYKCPNCNCSSCLDKKEEEKPKHSNCLSYGCYWCEKVNDPTYPCERCDAFEGEKEHDSNDK